MSIYGKLCGALLAVTMVGGGAAYITSVGNDTMSELNSIIETLTYYELREYNGNIALFKDGCEEPEAVFSTPLDSLNPADAALISEGIRLHGISDVSRLIEDLELE